MFLRKAIAILFGASTGVVLGASPAALLQNAQGPTAKQLSLVKAKLKETATHSWELGTETETYLEYDWAPTSVFGNNPIPPPHRLPSNQNLSNVFAITEQIMKLRAPDAETLFEDTAAGDPASLGVAVLLGNWTNANWSSYGDAATKQLNYLLYKAPRGSDGVISHRTEQVQLWSDSVYMVPPFLAYYAALQGNKTLLKESYTQIQLYRSHLRDPATGAWRHILEGSWNDPGLWSTGNGWAAMGMLRVYQTILNSKFSNEFSRERKDLITWSYDIVKAMVPYQQSNGTFLNYLAQPSSFAESSATALFAAVIYRLAAITPSAGVFLPYAEKARKLIARSISPDGYLLNVVNPNDFALRGDISPEGQAFVLMMEAARRDYLAD
ncbi:hypothetical protein BOTBODRAFT_36004 [Botryobasidium botryosum FD-172 SS1]|uniref:Glycoside hydrolase family 105 protein n=1 Tax=Botryobasidium botryosum (strain FD-172 SS1) TaxID=930990 RepID=A0A067MGI3_BOTB1|nr:hypothetical protein BOTBODRAFT_36004 [Botryobasidium botryosum FD-172 SS1]